MTVDLTASHDARQLSAVFQDEEQILWLRPRRAKRASTTSSSTISRRRKALLRLTTAVGIGACLTVAVPAATGPASAADSTTVASIEPQIAAPSAAGLDRDGSFKSEPIRIKLPSNRTAPAKLTDRLDPLATLIPIPAIPAIEPGDLRADIIKTLPITSPTASQESEGGGEGSLAGESIMTFEEMRVPRWIVDAVLRASHETGVDPVYMMALADKESSFIPANKASTSSAEGLYQFITGTWLEVMKTFGAKHGFVAEAEAIQMVDGQLTVADANMREHILGLRRNPYISALMAAEMKKRDRTRIESKLGREISRSEFYLSHFFGADSARKFMSLVDAKPKQSASRLFPAAARANKALFYAKEGRKTRQLTVVEVYEKIDEMIDKRLNRYEDVSAQAVAGLDL